MHKHYTQILYTKSYAQILYTNPIHKIICTKIIHKSYTQNHMHKHYTQILYTKNASLTRTLQPCVNVSVSVSATADCVPVFLVGTVTGTRSGRRKLAPQFARCTFCCCLSLREGGSCLSGHVRASPSVSCTYTYIGFMYIYMMPRDSLELLSLVVRFTPDILCRKACN